jgi:hypothetical protein
VDRNGNRVAGGLPRRRVSHGAARTPLAIAPEPDGTGTRAPPMARKSPGLTPPSAAIVPHGGSERGERRGGGDRFSIELASSLLFNHGLLQRSMQVSR